MIDETGAGLGAEAARRLAERARAECRLGPGLTPEEFARIEEEFGFEFADDHRAFLAAALPLNIPPLVRPGVIQTWPAPWPDWRDGDRDALRERLAWPIEGVLFDVENNAFWQEDWGPRPESKPEALTTARAELAKVPVLVPLYGHRFLPAGRGESGHPVLSMWQTDIIYYGTDVADWVTQEFGGPGLHRADPAWQPRATVTFWKDFL